MSATPPPWISAERIFTDVSFTVAVRAIQRELRAGLDPSADFRRSILDLEHGQLLLMPSQSAEFVGVKVATVAPGNAGRGLERIQGVYVIMDAATLTPIATMDGTALTTLRTPAVSAAAADLLAPAEVEHLVVFGSGPQAWGHIEAIGAIRSLKRVTVIARHHGRASALVDRVNVGDLEARLGVASDVRDAQVIVCATTATDPLFDGSLVPDDSCSIAVGSHDAGSREIDSVLVGRAQVVVEDVGVALRESGDVAIPIAQGVILPSSLIPMRDIVDGSVAVDRTRPRVFTSSGMSWQDLVVASEVVRAVL